MTSSETLAFFVNIYNTLVIHALLLVGFPGTNEVEVQKSHHLVSKLEWIYLSRSGRPGVGRH
jgi:hypothetical protein